MVGITGSVRVAEVWRPEHRRGHRDVYDVNEKTLGRRVADWRPFVVAVLDVEEVVWVRRRHKNPEGIQPIAVLRRHREFRGTRGERVFARLLDLRIGGRGDEGMVDVAAVGGPRGAVVPRQARRALETVVLLRRVVVVGRTEAVAEFVDECAAVPGIRHLRNGVRPKRIGPHDLGIISRKLVNDAFLQGLRRRLRRIERPEKAFQKVGVLVHRAAVDIARICTLLLKLPLRLHEL